MKNFLIYKSSAGSGKTYTLVKEYIKLVLKDENNFRHTLAVTFTNKAAAEMKTRIIKSLGELAAGKAAKLREQLVKEGIEGNIEHKAHTALQKILHHYSYFSVSTIDSFFHKVIRSFAKELKLPLGYDIELDHAMVMNKIVDDLLEEITENPELKRYLEEFIFFSMDENKGWKIETKIKSLASEIFAERYWIKKTSGNDAADNRKNINEFTSVLFPIIKGFESKMAELGENSLKIIADSGLEISDFKAYTASYFEKLVNRKNYPGGIEPLKTTRKISAGDDNWFTKTSKKKEHIEKTAASGLQKNIEEAVKHYDKSFKGYITAKELIKTIYILGVFTDLLEKLALYREANAISLPGDITRLLKSVISSESAPFVYEKIGSIYKNILIDEFQDTSTYQWNNFFPLVVNSLSENNFSMIVGDVKQSIYRWRNGNMKLLLEGVKQDLVGFKEMIGEKPLNENFRSRKEIIDFNNEFFKKASFKLSEKCGEDAGSVIVDSYKEVTQGTENAKPGGYVNFSFIYRNKESEFTPRERAIRKTIDSVKESLDEGYRQGDILLLVRKKSEGSDIAASLSGAGLRVVSNESLLLINSPGVKLLINLFKYIADSKNILARTEILYNYLIYIKKEEHHLNDIFTDHMKKNGSLFEEHIVKKLGKKLYNLNLYELTEALTSIFRLNENADAYLLRFLDAVEEYSTKYNTDINGFIGWWEEKKYDISIIVPEQEDAVKVLTIHKAKGLQSPVVIIPFANWDMDISGSKDMIWVSGGSEPYNRFPAYFVRANQSLQQSHFENDYNEEAVLTRLDNLNLLYVAFTRAMERLYVIVPQRGDNKYNAGRLIEDTLEKNEDFEIGSKTVKDSREVTTDTAYRLKEIISSDISEKVVIKPLSQGIKLERKKSFSELKDRGIILHKALSYINIPSDEEIRRAALQVQIDGMVTKEFIEEMVKELAGIFKSKEMKSWFSEGYEVKSESELIPVYSKESKGKEKNKIRRPDRVLLKGNKAIVIDYKTGAESNEHEKQVNDYAEILESMGYEVTEKYLYYTDGKGAMKIK